MTRRTAIVGSALASASVMASSTCLAATGTFSDAERSEWLRKNLLAVRSLDPTDETYDDLEPMAAAIGSARLVLLGESSHGAGSDFKAKVRLIKFLCQRMGFDVIVWESGFHAMNQVNAALRSMGDPVAAAKRGIFTIWSDTQEVEPLFKWVQSSWLGRRPIEMAGFDTQITAEGAEDLLFGDLRQLAARCPVAELSRIMKAHVERAISSYKQTGGPSATVDAVSDVSHAIDGIVGVIDGHRRLFEETNGSRELSFLQRALENLRCFAELRFEASQGRQGPVGMQLKDPTAFFNRRDKENTENIRWLLDVGYPGRKIIVWAHNVHIIKTGFGRDFGPIGAHPDGMIPMGSLIANALRDDCYSIGCTSYDGVDAWANAPKAAPIPPVPSDSLEAQLHGTGLPYGFVNLRNRKSKNDHPIKERLFVPAPGATYNTPDGIFSVSMRSPVFDGVFFIDHMTPATPLKSHP
jgi:erythromycin esterase